MKLYHINFKNVLEQTISIKTVYQAIEPNSMRVFRSEICYIQQNFTKALKGFSVSVLTFSLTGTTLGNKQLLGDFPVFKRKEFMFLLLFKLLLLFKRADH